jgi:hypothetical protein
MRIVEPPSSEAPSVGAGPSDPRRAPPRGQNGGKGRFREPG